MVDCLGVEINIITLFSYDSDLYLILKIYFSIELNLIDQSFELVRFLFFYSKCMKLRMMAMRSYFFSQDIVSPKDTLLFSVVRGKNEFRLNACY